MTLPPSGARERGHDDPGAGLDRGLVRRQVELPERRVVEVRDALVDAVRPDDDLGGRAQGRPAIAERNASQWRTAESGSAKSSPWRPWMHAAPKPGDERRVLAVSLVGPTPADVLGDRDDRARSSSGCRPRPTRRPSPGRSLDEVRVTGRTERRRGAGRSWRPVTCERRGPCRRRTGSGCPRRVASAACW